jgi:nucleoid-associated protein YgaU
MRNDKLDIVNKKGKGNVYVPQALPYIPPSDSDILIYTTAEDRLDLLALSYYNDSNLWWVIAMANNLTDIDLKLNPGTQLRIPMRASEITQYLG